MSRACALLAIMCVAASGSPAPAPLSSVFEIDISPEEAQRYLASPPFTEPQLSGRTAVLPLVRWNDPRFRSADAGPTLGHYWRNGHEIENTDDYVEEVYEASQFHGQDGLGAYSYGYSAPESSKVENRQRSGDVAGSYTYRDGNDELIEVRYWADAEGFHQEDNLPKTQPQPAQETEDVRRARLAHEAAWREAAEAAARQPDPQGEYSASEAEYAGAASAPAAAAARDARQYSAQAAAASPRQRDAPHEEPEPTGPPRGFFYSFDYPVSIIVAKSAGQPTGAGAAVDHDTVGVSARRATPVG